jgi:hypothetical protein
LTVTPVLVVLLSMSDREGPCQEVSLAAGEMLDVPDHLEKELTEQVVRLRSAASSQIAEQRGREVSMDRGPGPLLPGPGRHQHSLRAIVGHH